MSSQKKEVKKSKQRVVILDDDSDFHGRTPPIKREPEIKEVKNGKPIQE